MWRTKVGESWEITDETDVIRRMSPETLLIAATKIGIKWQEIATSIVTDKGIVDTGALRMSLNYKATESNVRVGAAVKYAVYNELGTSKMPARPFIVPAIKDNGDLYEEIVVNEYQAMLATRLAARKS